MPVRLVILGGGPAGNTAATVAATLGADVTVIEREIVGGAAHLRDCIPSKAMIATGGALAELTRAQVMGLSAEGRLDLDPGVVETERFAVRDRPDGEHGV